MNENQHVHRYTVAFKEYADELRWADDVLHPLYYWGLPDRIKDLWAWSDPPPLFADLVAQAQRADLRYWRRVDEKKKIQIVMEAPPYIFHSFFPLYRTPYCLPLSSRDL